MANEVEVGIVDVASGGVGGRRSASWRFFWRVYVRGGKKEKHINKPSRGGRALFLFCLLQQQRAWEGFT